MIMSSIVYILAILSLHFIKSPFYQSALPVPVVNAYESRGYEYCYNPIICIRDVGEELGVPNQEIMALIRVGKCESGLKPDALGVNTNGTVDRGIFQINSIHKGLSNTDAFDFEKNIHFAYRLYLTQGLGPWSSSKKCWVR